LSTIRARAPNADRQESAHPHSINVDPSDRFAIVCDLGQDRVFVYRLDAASGTLTPNDPPFVRWSPRAPARGTSRSTRTASTPS
jgi:6-phosphogluconolactonase